MSATWYTWLEQQRPIKVSANVLDNLARVLKLNPIERVQLFQLALRHSAIEPAPPREEVSPLIQRTLDRMDTVVAFIMGPRWDVLAWNLPARAFFFDFETVPREERNLVWLTFTSPALRSLLVDWPTRAQDILARFRGDHGRHAGDPYFVQLVERLNSVSAEFALWWPRHDVRPQSEGRKQYNHPLTGPLLARASDLFDDRQSRVATDDLLSHRGGRFYRKVQANPQVVPGGRSREQLDSSRPRASGGRFPVWLEITKSRAFVAGDSLSRVP